jgi:hypothetical protein
MNRTGVELLGVACLISRATASVAAQTLAVSEVSGTIRAPYILPVAPANPFPVKPLYTFGGFGVYVWAPVAPPYDANHNGNLAANSVWGQ